MAVTVTHPFVSAISDGADATVVRPSNWNATHSISGTLDVANGGTNIASYAIGDLIYASTVGVLSKLADVATGNSLISGGVGVAPSYGKVGLTTHVSGTLPVANGGTNITSYTIGDIVYASTAGILSSLADVATGSAIISGGVGVAPSYGKVGLTTHISGVLPVANGGTNASTASITSFNNITGYTASGATGTTSTNLVFSASPTFTGTVAAAAITASTTLGVTGVSTLTGGAVIQGLTVGLGANAVAGNTAVGVTALALNTTGNSNVGVGENANTNNLTGSNNTALGRWALINNTGASNIGLGANSGTALTTGNNNTIIGSVAGTAGLSDTVIIAAGAAERMRIDSTGLMKVPGGISGGTF